MRNESSPTEPVNTTSSMSESTPKEREKPSAETAPKVDTTTETLTRYAKEPSSLSESSPPVEKVKETEGSKSEPTPTELVGLGQPPYITDLIGAGMAYETFDVKERLGKIDEFIREDITDSRDSYKKALDRIVEKIGEQDDIYTKIDRMAEYVEIQQKIKEVIKEKEKFEAKSPEDMSAQELRRLLAEKHYERY